MTKNLCRQKVSLASNKFHNVRVLLMNINNIRGSQASTQIIQYIAIQYTHNTYISMFYAINPLCIIYFYYIAAPEYLNKVM